MAILGLIPARGGSKGIPRKNVLPIAGKPLIAWTIEAALVARNIDRVVVTTDDDDIADVSKSFGADVPFMRPAELARDETPGIDPVLHAIDALSEYDTIVLLQPTSPLRMAIDIDAAVAMSAGAGGAPIVSVSEAKHAAWIFAMDDRGVIDIPNEQVTARRQDIPMRYALNGAIYISDPTSLRANRTFLLPGTLGFPMPAERSVDIDSALDWRFAEFLLSERRA